MQSRVAELRYTTVSADPDNRIFDAANRQQPALIKTLKGLVMIESGSEDVIGLASMVALLDALLTSDRSV